MPTAFQLFLLNFPRLHQLVMRFFLRMWHESGSKVDDLGRVSFLVRSQIRLSLADEASKTWLHLERDFLETPYATIRERQMEILEKEDGTMNRSAVKQLREKLNGEAQDVMMEQRYVPLPVVNGAEHGQDCLYATGLLVQCCELDHQRLDPVDPTFVAETVPICSIGTYLSSGQVPRLTSVSQRIKKHWHGTIFQPEPIMYQRSRAFAKRVRPIQSPRS